MLHTYFVGQCFAGKGPLAAASLPVLLWCSLTASAPFRQFIAAICMSACYAWQLQHMHHLKMVFRTSTTPNWEM